MPSASKSQLSFRIHTRLSQHSRETSLLGIRHGREVLIKVCRDANVFALELARRKALAESPFDSGLTAVFPPAIHGKNDSTMMDWLKGWVSDEIAQGQFGVLVMPWSGGRPLRKAMAAMNDLERIHYLLELIELLRDFERRGVILGSLCTEDFWLVGEEVRWVGLAPCASVNPLQMRPSPMVVDFCRNYLVLLRRPGRRLSRWIKKPVSFGPPDPDHLAYLLRRRRRDLRPRKNLEILVGFLRPLHLIMWTVLVLAAGIWMWSRGAEPQIKPQRVEILTSKAPPMQKAKALRALLGGVEEKALMELLVGDIAQLELQSGRVTSLDTEDPHSPIAVLILPKLRAIIGHMGVYRLGDWVRLGSYQGYISDIRFNGFELNYKGTLKWMQFEHPRLPVYQPYESRNIIVWNHPDNLDQLLRGLAFLKNIPYRGFLDNQGRLQPIEGKVHGIFRVSRIEDFLINLEEHVGRLSLDRGLMLTRPAPMLPVYHKFSIFITKDKPLREIAEDISATLGYEIKVNPEIQEERFTLYVANMTWQRLLDYMGLDWRPAQLGNRKYIEIRHVHRDSDQF